MATLTGYENPTCDSISYYDSATRDRAYITHYGNGNIYSGAWLDEGNGYLRYRKGTNTEYLYGNLAYDDHAGYLSASRNLTTGSDSLYSRWDTATLQVNKNNTYKYISYYDSQDRERAYIMRCNDGSTYSNVLLEEGNAYLRHYERGDTKYLYGTLTSEDHSGYISASRNSKTGRDYLYSRWNTASLSAREDGNYNYISYSDWMNNNRLYATKYGNGRIYGNAQFDDIYAYLSRYEVRNVEYYNANLTSDDHRGYLYGRHLIPADMRYIYGRWDNASLNGYKTPTYTYLNYYNPADRESAYIRKDGDDRYYGNAWFDDTRVYLNSYFINGVKNHYVNLKNNDHSGTALVSINYNTGRDYLYCRWDDITLRGYERKDLDSLTYRNPSHDEGGYLNRYPGGRFYGSAWFDEGWAELRFDEDAPDGQIGLFDIVDASRDIDFHGLLNKYDNMWVANFTESDNYLHAE